MLLKRIMERKLRVSRVAIGSLMSFNRAKAAFHTEVISLPTLRLFSLAPERSFPGFGAP
jgi:hypothetical protein